MSAENGSATRPLARPVAGFTAAGWSLMFALIHVAWAAGWYVGLQPEEARAAFQRPWFYRYNLLAAGLCALVIPVALALTRSFKDRLTIRLLIFLAGSVTAILALRGIAGVVKAGYLGVTGQAVLSPMFLWDLWFCLGATLFGTAVWHFKRLCGERLQPRKS